MSAAFTPAQKRAQALAKQGTNQVSKSESTKPSGRKDRVPLGVPRKKLEATPIEGKHLHWVNDYPGRISGALQSGYEFVNENETSINDFVTPGNADLGSQVKRLVGKDDNGGPLFAYLMKIDEDLWLEDQAELQSKNDLVDDAIRRGDLNRVESQYGSVKLS